jgi:hypothetical protein
MRKTLLSILIFSFLAPITFADDASTLPQGRFRLRWVSAYTQTDNKFDGSGNIGNSGSPFTRPLNSALIQQMNPGVKPLITALNNVQSGLGDNLNVANLNTEIDSFFMSNVFVAEYGLTKDLSVGVIVPTVYGHVDVNSTSSPDDQFVGLMESLPNGHPLKTALSDLQTAMTTQGLDQALTSRYKYNKGIEDWSGNGLGDIEVGAKYRYYNSTPLRMAVKAGTRIPTGRTDDPDLLFDVGFGDGQWDIEVHHMIDYFIRPELFVTAQAIYTAQLPHNATFRAIPSQEFPLSDTSVKLNRNKGDYWQASLETNYTFLKYISVSSRYRFMQKFKDAYTGDDTVNTDALADNSNQLLHEIHGSIEFSNLPNVRAGTSKFPFAVQAFYKQPLYGKNVSDVRTTGLQFKAYF